MKSRLSAAFARAAAPIMIAFALTAAPALAQGGPHDGEIQIDIPYEEYAPLSSEISKSHITLINKDSTPQQIDVAIQALVGMSMHRSANVRSEALYSLKNIANNNFPADRRDPANDALVLLAKTGRVETRSFLAENLYDFIDNPRYAEFALAFQADQDENVRYYFMLSQKRAAERNDSQDGAIIGYALDAADDPSPRVREAAGDTMTVLARRVAGTHLPRALAFFEEQLNDGTDSVRYAARLNLLRIAEIHAATAPRAVDVARQTFADPKPYGASWTQSQPVDLLVKIVDKHPAHRAAALAVLEEAATAANPLYKIRAAAALATATAAGDAAEHPVALRMIPMLLQSGEPYALNAAANAARDIALSNPSLDAQALALLGQTAEKSRFAAGHLVTVAEKRPATLPAVTAILETLAASAQDTTRGAGLESLSKIAALPGADITRLYTVFTRAFSAAEISSVSAAQAGLTQLTARDPALSVQTTDTFAARVADPLPAVRGKAALGLGQLAANPATADPRQLALIIPMATDPSTVTRTDVVRALALAAGNPAFTTAAFNRLAGMANDTHEPVRSEILSMLQKTTDPALLGHPAYIRALSVLRHDTGYSIGNSAKTLYSNRLFSDLNRLAPLRNRLETDLAATLGNPGAAPAFVADAASLLGSIDPVTRMKGTDMLGQIGFAHPAQASAVIAALAPLAEDYETDIRFTVVRHVGMIGMKTPAAAESALQALASLARDADGRVSGMAVMAIGKIGSMNPALKDDAQAILRPLEQSAPPAAQGAIRQQLRLLGP